MWPIRKEVTLGRSEETQPELSFKDNVCQGVNKGKGETAELKEQGGANLHDKEFRWLGYRTLGNTSWRLIGRGR